jgi:glutathione S-transferase
MGRDEGDRGMYIYNSFGPNPRALRMFLLEKKLVIPTKDVDLMGAENRKPPYTDKNPGAQVPALELDDGTVIGETVAIFEFLEETHPQPPLVGSNAKERAETRQWQRRVELKITEYVYNGFRFAEGLQLFQDRMRCLPEAAAGLKATAQDGLVWLDKTMDGKQWIVGNRFTIADIILYCALDFGIGLGQTIPAGAPKVKAWFDRVGARPSASASLHPAHQQIGMKG